MLQELQRAFDELPGWDLEDSLLIGGQAEVHDLNYGWIPGADTSRAATVARPRVAREFARTAAEAKVLILPWA